MGIKTDKKKDRYLGSRSTRLGFMDKVLYDLGFDFR